MPAAVKLISVKRVYEKPARGDGHRVLVDRLWPRGVSKREAELDAWLRDLAPLNELRRWFHARPHSWLAFRKRYLKELALPGAAEALDELYRLVLQLTAQQRADVARLQRPPPGTACASPDARKPRRGPEGRVRRLWRTPSPWPVWDGQVRRATATATMPGPTWAPRTAPISPSHNLASPSPFSSRSASLGQLLGPVGAGQVGHSHVDLGVSAASTASSSSRSAPWPRCAPSRRARSGRRDLADRVRKLQDVNSKRTRNRRRPRRRSPTFADQAKGLARKQEDLNREISDFTQKQEQNLKQAGALPAPEKNRSWTRS